jgi:large subunit ribosomal protein L4
MFKASYYKADGKKGRARALPATIFDGVVNNSAMHQVVKAYLSNQRQGTAAAKTRSDVRGGSRKPWKQKGTGRARQGTIRAVQWAGGGVAFPPIPHSWRKRVPKKIRSLARRSALNDRAEHDRVVLVDLPAMEAPKTRDLNSFLNMLGLEGKTLILTDGINTNLHRSSRNLQSVQVLPFGTESVYDVLWANTVVIESEALDQVSSTKVKAEKVTDEPPVEEAPEEVAAESSTEEAVAEPASDEGEE